MVQEIPGTNPLEAHRPLVERLSAAACLRDRQGIVVASSAAAQALWQGDLPDAVSGFSAVRDPSGAVWEGWRALGNPAAMASGLRIGERSDGSRVEYISYPSVVADPSGRPCGLLEILVPLSPATVPKGVIHDLTNAVGVILGNADLALLEVSSQDDVWEHLHEIRTAALQVREIVRQAVPSAPVRGPEIFTSRARVLCIDDDEAFLLLAGRALQRLGCEVRTYASAEEALSDYLLKPESWDLIAIDSNLLGREGVEVAQEFLRRNPALRICIASGAVDEDLEARAREAGVCRVISKPTTVPEFAQSFGELLAGLTQPPDPP